MKTGNCPGLAKPPAFNAPAIDTRKRLQPEMVVEAEAGEEADAAYCPGQLTPAQFAYLFREVLDSATFDRARKRVTTWQEWSEFLAQWDAEHGEELLSAWGRWNRRRRRAA